MKSQEFEQIINNSYVKQRQAVYEKLKQKLDIPEAAPEATVESRTAKIITAENGSAATDKPASKWRNNFKNFFKKPARIAACVSMAAAVACLAIILPFTLNNRNGLQPALPPTTTDDRFCVAAACKQIELKYSLREYSALNKLSLLYVDWYDVVDIKTSVHVANADQTDIIYYEEVLKHRYTGSIAELYITDLHTMVDKLNGYKRACNHSYVTKKTNVSVSWGVGAIDKWEPYTYNAYFKYGDYIYVIVLRYPMSENDIFELIDSMLSQAKK